MGKAGWEGTIQGCKSKGDSYVVTFKDDLHQYWFDGKDVRSWLILEAHPPKAAPKAAPKAVAPKAPPKATHKAAPKADTPKTAPLAAAACDGPVEATGSSGGRCLPPAKRSAAEAVQTKKDETGLKPLPAKPSMPSPRKRPRVDNRPAFSDDKEVLLEQLASLGDSLTVADLRDLLERARALKAARHACEAAV